MLNRRQTLKVALATLAGGMAASGLPAQVASLKDRLTGDVSPAHDPCMIRDKAGLFHVFTTSHMGGDNKGLIHWRTSTDMLDWRFNGAVMAAFPDWVMTAIPETRGAWAPDIAFFNNRYYLYYSASTFGKNRSLIGLLSTPTLDRASPDFAWRDEGLVVESTTRNTYNAIDPNHVIDADGRHWLSFGSFWSGLKLIELDPMTGKPKAGAKVKGIAGRDPPGAIEAPFIFRRGDYYYLIAAYDFCCRGVDSSYYTVVGRSKTIEGPYLDDTGKKLSKGGGRVLLKAGMDTSGRFKGPGGASVVDLGDSYVIVYHAYDAYRGGVPTLRIQALEWSDDGWPVAV
jgi:arabinan endo-1,5-alpha-L-arabinosidase